MGTQVKINRAMVLAAGLGTRLRPLTNKVPKPLLPLDSHKLIDYPLFYLARHGIKDVMINLHHLADMIRGHAGDGKRYGLKITYSFEPEILGTGGGIKNAGAFFKDAPFVSMNADSLINADLDSMIKRHFESGAAATMVLKGLGKNEPYGGVETNNGFIKGFGRGKHFYTGLQVIGPDLMKILPPAGTVSCLIEDGYKKLLERGAKVAAYFYDGYFNDLGTPERYEQAKRDIVAGIFNPPIPPFIKGG